MRVAVPGGKRFCLKAEVRSQSGSFRAVNTNNEWQEAAMT